MVVHNVGLCIALWDIEKYEKTFIYPGDGATHTVVHFRFVVFRPFVDEILTGKVKSSTKEGIHVSMGFFDDIFIPAEALIFPSKFNEKEQLWAWEYQTDDAKHDLIIDIGEEVRFRVMEEKFVDMSPTGPDGVESTDSDTDAKKSPYTIIGFMADPGLGMLSWWNN
ncbi:DNA-directed RNA polymerase III subunit RPC8-like isoform X2 [Babylonia areolata]|uniref:DNA-directed RNA polymerase III subunit RPC8-like isoform X2 n=1 Tax=Babylonia areolata TaxID=304850 RepID=UPI003FD4827C